MAYTDESVNRARRFASVMASVMFGAGWLYGTFTSKDDKLSDGVRGDTVEYRQNGHSNNIGEQKVSSKAIVENIDEFIKALEEAKKFAEQSPHQAEILVRKQLLKLQENQQNVKPR